MKRVLPFMFAILAMGIAMVVMASVLHLDIKAEIGRLLPHEGSVEETPTPEPEPES